jgi:hypothetical protein
MFRFRGDAWRRGAHRLCAGLALAAYLATAVGFPMPADVVGKDRSRPFPCQDHRCACRSAEACWSHCCCLSLDERLAWAQAHDVEPPASVREASAAGWHSVRLRDQESHATCAACESRSPCCARSSAGHACCDSKPARPSSLSRNPRWVPGLAALQCQGQCTLWINGGAVLPPAPQLTWKPFWPLVGRLAAMSTSPSCLPHLPPDPPPRLLAG